MAAPPEAIVCVAGLICLSFFLCWSALYTFFSIPLKLLRAAELAALPASLDATKPPPMTCLTAFILMLEAPLAFLSYFMYVFFKPFWLSLLFLRSGRKKANSKFTDQLHFAVNNRAIDSMINSALSIGPRWNTHTNVHSWHVEVVAGTELVFEVENLQLPGFSWQVNFRGGLMQQALIASCAPIPGDPEWLMVKLTPPPGTNVINLQLRPYLFDGRDSAPLPFVKLDGKPLEQRTSSSAEPISEQTRVVFEAGRLAFNASLAARQKFHHKAMQFHMHSMLALDGSALSSTFVRSIYLPVGNPETQWIYGLVHEGFALHVKTTAALLKDHLVFCSVYNRASLPTIPSITCDTPEYALPTCPCDGFFAVRIVRKDGATTQEAVKAEVAICLKRAAAGKVA